MLKMSDERCESMRLAGILAYLARAYKSREQQTTLHELSEDRAG